MPNTDLSPLSVLPFSKGVLVDFVRYKTGWDQRSEVFKSDQLNYLCAYLAEAHHVATKTIVIESEYVDRNYLEDYSEYYARCFHAHPRKCARVHFFAYDFTEQLFLEALAKNDRAFIDSISANYIGFAVIRPIPHTFLARLCLKPYKAHLENTDEYKLITKKNSVSLFGIKLSVDSVVFLEQDKVISTCATSALGTFLGASLQTSTDNLPSPSAITKSASQLYNAGTRVFPTSGLTPVQVATSLKHFGLEPLWFECNNDGKFGALKETLYSYISNEIPILIGGDVYEKSDKGIKFLGKHFVCALGFHVRQFVDDERPGVVTYQIDKTDAHDERAGPRFFAHQIDKIYVHDDRFGPYMRISMEPVSFSATGEKGQACDAVGLDLLIKGDSKANLLVPEIALTGVYHKIRIAYKDIRNICSSFYAYLRTAARNLDQGLDISRVSDEDQKAEYKRNSAAIKRLQTGAWEISLMTINNIKGQVISSERFTSFNGTSNRNSFLLASLPRYIWRCRILECKQEKPIPITDILFDATEIPQGRVLIGYVSYDLDAERVWKYVETVIDSRHWETYKVNEDAKKYGSTFLKFFTESKEKTFLNSMYGALGLPRRELKDGEADTLHNVNRRTDVFTMRRGLDRDWNMLDREKPYIWVINEIGDLVFGEDIGDPKQGFKGHPTLIDGKPARIGGELRYSEQVGAWVISLRSGAYSSHLSPGSEASKIYLNNVKRINFVGLSLGEEVVGCV